MLARAFARTSPAALRLFTLGSGTVVDVEGRSGMVDIDIRDDVATFRIEGLHKLWALKSRIVVAVQDILQWYSRLVVEVARPDAARQLLTQAMAARGDSPSDPLAGARRSWPDVAPS
jgi:hypothetical protein